MGRFNWGTEGPPEDAYSRVTEPERFRPLHDWTLEALARLHRDYEVNRDEGTIIDAELDRVSLSRPILELTPLQDSCAPIAIAFTDFPGLGVRFGRWTTDWFPSCGCDACDEMPDSEFERFNRLLTDVVAGRFLESLHLKGGLGRWRSRGLRSSEFWSADHRSARKTPVPRDQASRILNGKSEIVLKWMPWQPKPGIRPSAG